MSKVKQRACVQHGGYSNRFKICPTCHKIAPTADSISLELANGEALGAHWIYVNRDMKDWYIKDEGLIKRP